VFLLALVIRMGGDRAEATLRRYIEPVGWVATVLVVGLLGWLVLKAKAG